MASKKTILSCDFDDGSLCGWTNKRTGGTVRWVTSNTSTPESNTGPLWGHPKGSYFAYTNTTTAAPNMEGMQIVISKKFSFAGSRMVPKALLPKTNLCH